MKLDANQEDMFNGIMFFIPLSKFLINEVKIIGDKLQLTYNNRLDESQIGQADNRRCTRF